MTYKRQRLPYIDVCKGLLILMVVAHHITNISGGYGIMSPALKLLGGGISYLFIGFFMQAFFILNGLTSNFNKPFKQFLFGSIKGLIIPFLSFSIILELINCSIANNLNLWIKVASGDQTWFFLFESCWFLTALFFARVVYWLIKNYVRNRFVQAIIVLTFLLCGILMNNIMDGKVTEPSHWNNYFHYRNAMCMIIFIWLGDILKTEKSHLSTLLKYGTIVYFILITVAFVCHSFGYGILPVYTHNSNVSLIMIPSYLLYATSGSLAIVWLSKKINRNSILEYFGKGSIVVYMIHFEFLNIVISRLSAIILPKGYITSVIFYIICFIVVSVMCGGMIWLMQMPYLRKLIGK